MKKRVNWLMGYTGSNPFKDHQARTFENEKLVNEFYPTSIFWSLFNDQHEILVGRRGSGKTILLKMMRYSLLKKMHHKEAKKIISEKKHIGIFTPMNLEFLGSFLHQAVYEKDKLLFFQFAFNCLLSRSFLHEINSIIDEQETTILKALKSKELAQMIANVWFPEIKESSINNIEDIDKKIINLYENTVIIDGLENVPNIFKKTICKPIQAVSSIIFKLLGCKEEPTWIICIDEAEFLPKELQRCINTLFRSDSKGIVIKVATLPYHHKTKETLIEKIFAESNGNDFSYVKVDMAFDSDDFKNVTNKLCKTRLLTTQIDHISEIETLESFLGKVGDDDLVDYYRLETKSQNKTQEQLLNEIIPQLSHKRKENINCVQKSIRKPIYDKFAPIFFTREMHKKSKEGNRMPGWYAGTKMVRKIAEGNPRRFIRIMNVIFEKAKENKLNPKAQHSVIINFTNKDCEATKALPIYGPPLHDLLDELAEQLKRRTHDNELIYSGNSFQINEDDFDCNKELYNCLELGVAYLHINVDEDSFFSKITKDTKFSLSNSFSANYWLPMRKGDYPKLKTTLRQKTFQFMKKK